MRVRAAVPLALLLGVPSCSGSSDEADDLVVPTWSPTTSSSVSEAEDANRRRATSMAVDGCALVPPTGEVAAESAHEAATYASAASAFDERFTHLRDALIAYDRHRAGEAPLESVEAARLLDEIRASCEAVG